MKPFLLSVATLCIGFISHAQMQSFAGYRSSNYAGVNSTFFNPSSIADSRYKWDVSLFSVNAGVANNKAAFNLNDVIKNFDEDELKTKLLSGSGSIDAQVNVDVLGPSFMLLLSPDHSIALTSRVRAVANVREMDGGLVNSIMDADDDVSLPYSLTSDRNSRVTVNGWAEFGASYARVLYSDAFSFIKGGVTLKYLAGVGNAFTQINNLSGTIDEDLLSGPYLDEGSRGNFNVGVGGINFANVDDFSFNGSGIGFDLGFTYEYRPGDETFIDDSGNTRINATKYKFKFGLALLDVGKIKYDKDPNTSGAYNFQVASGDRFYLDQMDNREIDEFKDVAEDPANNPRYFTSAGGNNETTYKTALPTSLAVDVDYNIHQGFYINLAGQASLTKKETVTDAASYSGISLTPRYEGKKIGVYLPLNYNSISEFNAGFGLSAGPFLLGSGSILTALLGDSKQADVFVGFRFGFLRNK